MSESRQELADRIGFELIDQPSKELMFELDQLYQGRDALAYNNVLLKRADEVRYAIGEMSWTSNVNQQGAIQSHSQTTVFFEGPNLELPPMTIEPAGMMTGIMSGLMSLVGVTRVKTGDDPEFDKQYYVGTMVPDAVRPLLTNELTEFLKSHPGLSISTNENRVGVAYKDQTLFPDEIPDLLRTATELIRMLTHIERQTRRDRPDANQLMQQKIAAGGGLAGLMRGTQLSQQAHDAFLDQRPPREVPPDILALKMGCGSIFLMIWGGFFGLIGSGLLIAGISVGEPIMMLLGGFFPLIGFGVLFFASRYRRRAKRMLTQGEVVEANIIAIERTNVEINNQRRYKVTFEFDYLGQSHSKMTNEYGPAVQQAKNIRGANRPTKLLVDPANPEKIMWLEGYVG